jgi:hypothetical protein
MPEPEQGRFPADWLLCGLMDAYTAMRVPPDFKLPEGTRVSFPQSHRHCQATVTGLVVAVVVDAIQRNYGARGIKFLYASFEDFFADLGDRPPGLTKRWPARSWTALALL